MADPNNLVVHPHRLVLMLTCKAANTSVKRALADALDLPRLDVPERLEPHRRIEVHLPTINKADAFELRQRGYLVVGFARHPLARLASCWRDKVQRAFHKPFARKYGDAVRPKMPFAAFVDFMARTPDGVADQHFRSMAWELLDAAGLKIPTALFKVDDDGWWESLREVVAGGCGLDLGPERQENRSADGNWQALYDGPHEAIARARYARDFTAFGYD